MSLCSIGLPLTWKLSCIPSEQETRCCWKYRKSKDLSSSLKRNRRDPRKGSYDILLTTHVSLKLDGVKPWVHHTRVRRLPETDQPSLPTASEPTPEKRTSHPLGNLSICSDKRNENSVFSAFLIPPTYRFICWFFLIVLTARYVVNFLFPGLQDCFDGFSPYKEWFGNNWLQQVSPKYQFQTGLQAYSPEFLREWDPFCLLKFQSSLLPLTGPRNWDLNHIRLGSRTWNSNIFNSVSIPPKLGRTMPHLSRK